MALQLGGGAYFLYLATKALLAANSASPSVIQASQWSVSLLAAYKRGLFVVLTNPKAAMMWAAVTAFLSGSGISNYAVLAYAPVGSISALVVNGTYGWVFSTPMAQKLYKRTARGFETAFGVLFGMLGAKLMYDGIRELHV